MVKKIIVLSLLLAASTIAVSADKNETLDGASGIHRYATKRDMDKAPVLSTKVTRDNQTVDEDSDGEGVSAYPRLSAIRDYGVSNKWGATAAWICSKICGWFVSF